MATLKAKGNIFYTLKDMKLPFQQEYVFHPTRKWRFDFALVDRKIAIEYEGIFTTGKSRHTTVAGYTGDAEKYNAATIMGWTVLRYTAKNYKNLRNDLTQLLCLDSNTVRGTNKSPSCTTISSPSNPATKATTG